MADRTLQILPGGQSPAPFTYVVPPTTAFTLLGVKASFNGAAAGGAFLPCVQLVSDAGVVMNYALGSSVAAGASADVSFAPFLEAQTTGGGSGLQFDTAPQDGDWFYAKVTGSGGPDGWGWEVIDENSNGVVFDAVPFLTGDVNQASNGAWFYLRGNGFQLGITNNQHYVLTTSRGNIFDGFVNFAGPQVGFLGATPVPRQPTPVTLGDVIALLQAFGLAA